MESYFLQLVQIKIWESEVERGRKLEQNRYDLSLWNGTLLTILST
jgi:hypothetical protein